MVRVELVLVLLAVGIVLGIPAFIAFDAARSTGGRGEGPPGTPTGPPPRLSTADVGLTGWGGAFVDPGGAQERLVLFLFPCANAAAFAELDRINTNARGKLAALVVFNHGEEGALCASRLARLFEPSLVLASATDRPLDRGPNQGSTEESGPVHARPLESLAAEPLALRALGTAVALGNPRASTLLGVDVPLETVLQERPAVFVGTIASSQDEVPKGLAEWLLGPDGRPPQVVLVNTGPKARVLDWTTAFNHLGVDPTVVGGSTRTPADRVLEVIAHIAVGELDAADDAAAALLVDHPGLGAAWFQRAVARTVRRDLPGAMDAFQRAADAPRPSPEAWTSLAALCVAQGDLERASSASQRALEELPRDPIGIRTAVLVRLLRGEKDAARALLTERGAALPEPVREELERALSSEVSVVVEWQRFSGHAAVAVERARAALGSGDRAAAERILRHALVLDPAHEPAGAALQSLLGPDPAP